MRTRIATASQGRPTAVKGWASVATAMVLVLAACAAPASSGADPGPGAPSTSSSASGDAGSSSAAPRAEIDPATIDERLKFEATTVDGDPFDGTTLAGQDSILWFWASWCPICQAEAPAIADAARQLPEGVTLYGVPGKSDQAGMEKFVADYGLEDVVHIVDTDGGLWSGFGVPYQPAFAFINDDGTIETVQGSLGTNSILRAADDLRSR